jgi:hypothetical protein
MLSHPLLPHSEKLVPYILARDYSGNRPSKHYAKSEAGANLVMYDVYWLAMILLSCYLQEYLEYISSISIMHNHDNTCTQWITW